VYVHVAEPVSLNEMTLIVAIADARDAPVYETISLRDVVDTV